MRLSIPKLTFILPVFFSVVIRAQVFPAEGATLHYRLIGFAVPKAEKCDSYTIEVAEGYYVSEDSFKKNILKTFSGKEEQIVGEVPSFGAPYTWRYATGKGSSPKKFSRLNHFSTLVIPEVDTHLCRLRVIKPAERHKDAYVFIDGHGVLYDMRGNPVWFVPDVDGSVVQHSQFRDVKITPQNTITYLLNDEAYEINYNGDMLWKGPNNAVVSGGNGEQYHHEFTRLSNGHYMVLGNEMVTRERTHVPLPKTKMDTSARMVNPPNQDQKTIFGTLIEYDEKGNVVWSWKSSSYFVGSDLENYIPPNKAGVVDVHENAFYFDEEDSVIYVSFRNISRIVKIKYPSGLVLHTYGEIYRPGSLPVGNHLFCEQHSCKRSREKYICVFNNNICESNEESLPNVLMMAEVDTGRDSLRVVWRYDCNTDEVHQNPRTNRVRERIQNNLKDRGIMPVQTKIRPTSGGNVIELPDGSIFVAMNVQYGKVFIVDRDKHLLWSAVPERFSGPDAQWYVSPEQYRASIVVDKKIMERLIWTGEAK